MIHSWHSEHDPSTGKIGAGDVVANADVDIEDGGGDRLTGSEDAMETADRWLDRKVAARQIR